VTTSRNLAPVWWTGFLALLFALTGCSDETREERFTDLGCARCHGQKLAGTRLGPPLLGLDSVWREESLIEYLTNPADYRARDARLQEVGSRFSVHMPQTPMSDETRREIARYILDRE
jgi:cytochrome c553